MPTTKQESDTAQFLAEYETFNSLLPVAFFPSFLQKRIADYYVRKSQRKLKRWKDMCDALVAFQLEYGDLGEDEEKWK